MPNKSFGNTYGARLFTATDSGDNFRSDLLCRFLLFAVRLVVEVDGNQHAEPANALRDKRRTAWLNRNEFHVIRFAASDVMTGIDGVLEEIVRAVTEREQLLRYR